MSIRSTGFFVSTVASAVTITFNTKALQIIAPTFDINTVRIPFTTKVLNATGVKFNVEKGKVNYYHGFMAF